jgi:hypothetical protein
MLYLSYYTELDLNNHILLYLMLYVLRDAVFFCNYEEIKKWLYIRIRVKM